MPAAWPSAPRCAPSSPARGWLCRPETLARGLRHPKHQEIGIDDAVALAERPAAVGETYLGHGAEITERVGTLRPDFREGGLVGAVAFGPADMGVGETAAGRSASATASSMPISWCFGSGPAARRSASICLRSSRPGRRMPAAWPSDSRATCDAPVGSRPTKGSPSETTCQSDSVLSLRFNDRGRDEGGWRRCAGSAERSISAGQPIRTPCGR
jgi:hypothetical protein